jgi:hypothetical protein
MNAIGKSKWRERKRGRGEIGKLLDHLNAKCARTESQAQKKGDKMYGSAIWRIFHSLDKKIFFD